MKAGFGWVRSRSSSVSWLACLLLASCAGTAPNIREPLESGNLDDFPPTANGGSRGASKQALDTAAALGRGINLGNVFEAPREGDWGLTFKDNYFDAIAAAGFKSVRIPVRWSNHAAATADATIDSAFAARIDHVIDGFLARGLTVVVNVHHYRQLDGDTLDANESAVSASVVRVRFLNLWKQIAQRYKDRSDKLVFELYNEPHGAQQSTWNDLAARGLNVVRQRNPKRMVVIGPVTWNSASSLAQLSLPDDDNLIVTVHNYNPFQFTHQGASWVGGSSAWLGTTCCSAAQKRDIIGPLDTAAAWSAAHRYPIWLGEFGSYGKGAIDSRVVFTRLMRDEAEKRNIPWAYWEFASGFGAYNPTPDTWRTPLEDALLGP